MDGPFHDERIVRDVAREIAREVARDSHEAEDLAQDAWLRSLTHPPRHWTYPRAWMRQVARRIAIKRHRSDDARRERETRHARHEAEPGAPEVLARLEIARELRRALRALDPLDRRILLLRFVEDEPPRRIARQLGMPVETVRSRIKRALPKLREKLERRGRGKGSWLPALVAVFPEQAPEPRFATPWIPLGATALIAGAVLVPLLARSPDPEGLAASPPLERPEEVARLGSRREPLGLERAATSASEADAKAGAVRGELSWAGGEPAEGVRVRLERVDERGSPLLATSERDGGFLVSGLEPGVWRVAPERGLTRLVRVDADAVTRVALALPDGRAVEGRVLGPEERPVVGAAVWLSWPARPEEHEVAAWTGDDGRFRIEAADPDAWILASAEGLQASLVRPLRDPSFAGEEALEVELQLLDAGRYVAGLVVDSEGEPIPGAEVELVDESSGAEKPLGRRQWPFVPPPARTDADGRFLFERVWRGEYTVVARAPDLAPGALGVSAFAPTPDKAPLKLVTLLPGRALEGRLLTRSGAPAAGARVVVGPLPWFRERVVRADEKGEFRVEHLPGCALEVRAELHAGGRALGAWTRFARHVRDERWDATLDEGGVLEGVALDAGGGRAAGWTVRALAGGTASTARFAVCDAAGRFALAGCKPTEHRLELFAPGAILASASTPLARPGSGSIELYATRTPASIGGWLVGAEREERIWLVNDDDSEQRLELPRKVTDGAFEAEGLLAGRWRLELWEAERCARLLERFTLTPGERLELGALAVGTDGRLRVRVPEGIPASDVSLQEAGETGRTLSEIATPDEDGWIAWTLPPGAYVIELGGSRAARERHELALAPGGQVEYEPELPELHEVEILLGPARVTSRDAEGRLEIRDRQGFARVVRTIPLVAHASSVEVELPVGEYVLTLHDRGREIARKALTVSAPGRLGPIALGVSPR